MTHDEYVELIDRALDQSRSIRNILDDVGDVDIGNLFPLTHWSALDDLLSILAQWAELSLPPIYKRLMRNRFSLDKASNKVWEILRAGCELESWDGETRIPTDEGCNIFEYGNTLKELQNTLEDFRDELGSISNIDIDQKGKQFDGSNVKAKCPSLNNKEDIRAYIRWQYEQINPREVSAKTRVKEQNFWSSAENRVDLVVQSLSDTYSQKGSAIIKSLVDDLKTMPANRC